MTQPPRLELRPSPRSGAEPCTKPSSPKAVPGRRSCAGVRPSSSPRVPCRSACSPARSRSPCRRAPTRSARRRPPPTSPATAASPLAQVSISASVAGFGGGIAYYPTATGTYPVISMSPGFTASWSSISWLGPRLASWGFVVVGIETNSRFDQPDQPRHPAHRRAQLGRQLARRPPSGRASTAAAAAWPATPWAAVARSRPSRPHQPAASSRPGCRWRRGTQDKTWGEGHRAGPDRRRLGRHDRPGWQQHSIPFYNSLGGQKSLR